jgi:hypothetical protein
MPGRDPLDELARAMALGLRRRTILRLAGASVCAALGAAVMPRDWLRSPQAEAANRAFGFGQGPIQDQVPGGGSGSPSGGGVGAGGAAPTGGTGTTGGTSGGGAGTGTSTAGSPPSPASVPTGNGGAGGGVLINGSLLGIGANNGYVRLNGTNIFCTAALVQAGTCCPLGVEVAPSRWAMAQQADADFARGPSPAADGAVPEVDCLGGKYCQGTDCGPVVTPANSPCADWPSGGGLPSYIGCAVGFTCCNGICCLPGQACVAGVCEAASCSAARGCPYGLPCCNGVCCLQNQTCVAGVCKNPSCGPNLPCPGISPAECCNGVCCPVGQNCRAGVCQEGPS